ncbi:MAG: hypothetical protein NDI63_00920 [Pseudobdellovibrio sp.]|nr:hypothetical protein [Pseudobdellovibrio sp.]
MKTIALLLLISPLFASANDCSQAVAQLRQMKAAQLSVQDSLIKNHEMMADSMESYADALKESSGRAHKTVSNSMLTASSSLRKRGEKGQELAEKLAEQTDLIIKNVENCLK